MKEYFKTDKGVLYQGEALAVLKTFPDHFFDTVITDPPYGLSEHKIELIKEVIDRWVRGEDDYIPKNKGFMNAAWDAFVPPPALWKEVYRTTKPGATVLVFAGTRTYDLMTISLRLAGFEIKDTLMWLYGQGFPKGQDVSSKLKDNEEAKIWQGIKTHLLKPAYEPIILAIKPNDGSYAQNAVKWKVAGLNIENARIGYENIKTNGFRHGKGNSLWWAKYESREDYQGQVHQGRFPANVLLTHDCEEECRKDCPVAILDGQYGFSRTRPRPTADGKKLDTRGTGWGFKRMPYFISDEGGASRFFYVAKVSSRERGEYNNHPTCKPLKLIEYLIRLTTMPNPDQIYLDPFLGSGTTALACENLQRKWIGIELKEEYCEIAKKRLLGGIEK